MLGVEVGGGLQGGGGGGGKCEGGAIGGERWEDEED